MQHLRYCTPLFRAVITLLLLPAFGVALAVASAQSMPSAAALSEMFGARKTLSLVEPLATSSSGMAHRGMSQSDFASASIQLSDKPLILTSEGNRVEAFTNPLIVPPVLTGANITLEARDVDIQIRPGAPTRMWTYSGSFLGPTIRRPTGQTTYVTLVNNLPSSAGSLTLHNHGNHSAPSSDGQADTLLVEPGASRVYTYTGLENGENERGTMQFYHDHRMDVTGRNLWMGMAGLYIIDDPQDPQTLPSGEFDVPLAVMDRAFNSGNQLVYRFSSAGVMGDTILVDGVVQPYFEVADRKYRFRILNASNFRQYDFQMSNVQQMLQVGTESGLLPAPVLRDEIYLGPGERADVVVDFAGHLGENIVLNNLMGIGSTSQVIQFRVTRHETDNSSVPPTLRPLPIMGAPVLTRTFEFDRSGGHWTINGLAYDPNRIDAEPLLGATEKWIIRDTSATPHVFHMHDVDQQLISRNGYPPEPYELMKESWSVGGNQTIEVLVRFTDYAGRYVFHCHMLEHEDNGMMMQLEVVAPARVLVGHATWQGAPPQPDARQQQPITLTIWSQTGGPQYDYPAQNTDASGFFTVTLAGLPDGVYNWRAKGPRFLSNSGTLTLSGPAQTNAEMYLMRAGDANNDNVVNTTDFNILKRTLGKSPGDPGYDPRADFNNDDIVNVSDFNLLKINFGQALLF